MKSTLLRQDRSADAMTQTIKMRPVAVAGENGAAFVATRGNLIPAAEPFNAKGSGHERETDSPIALGNC